MSNVKAGDIAIIVADDPKQPSPLAGRIVEVLFAAPVGDFPLPDGMLSRGGPNSWVVKFQNPVLLRLRYGSRQALYAACPDSKLRGIGGDDIPEAEVTELYLPTTTTPKEIA